MCHLFLWKWGKVQEVDATSTIVDIVYSTHYQSEGSHSSLLHLLTTLHVRLRELLLRLFLPCLNTGYLPLPDTSFPFVGEEEGVCPN